jgi:diguanylate cyclase (GGDEF)-like protein/PAS domain S-box-containing protein
MAALTGYEVSELEGRHVTELVHPDHRAAVRETIAMVGGGDASVARSDRCWRRADGCDIWVSVSSTILHDAAGAPRRILVQVVDITDRHRVEEELQHLAEHDPLTGLANRRNFEQALSLHRAAPDRAGEGAVVMLDLDGFKPINDTYGHRTGDRLLVGIARAVRRQLRHRDCIARLGGDEFAVLLTDADRAAAELVAKKLVGAVPRAGRSVLPAGAPRVTVSIGIALLSEGPADPDDILAAADRAMYAAKHGGRNQVAFAQWSGRWT